MIPNFPSIQSKGGERGSSLIEILFSLALFSVVAMALTSTSITSSRTTVLTLRRNSAWILAGNKIEELSSRSVSSLSDSDDSTELNVQVGAMTFSRITDITEESDGSRKIEVIVQAAGGALPPVSLTQVVFPWVEE